VELTGGGLTRQGFEALLKRLDPDRDRAGEKYEGLRRRLRRFFEWKGGRHPEEMADEAIDRACRRIAAGEVIRAEDPAQYLLGVARNVLREAWKRDSRAPEEPRDVDRLVDPQVHAEPSTEPERFACLQACLGALPPETARLVLEYYGEGGRERILKRKGLAEALGIPGSALRLRLHRVRARLEACVARCLQGQSETQGVSRPHEHEGGVREPSS
jgi:DNA-directed RNA polymerase specialized sigma24 family protein